MTDLDRIGKQHARALKATVSHVRPPTLRRGDGKPHGRRLGAPQIVIIGAATVFIALVPLNLIRSNETDLPTSSSAGWTFAEREFDIREGSAYVASDSHLFIWGGDTNDSSEFPLDGMLVDLRTLSVTPIPDAPIAGRYAAASIWTGEEFVVFGGHSLNRSFTDGAAYAPATGKWRRLSQSPFSPAPYPAATWTGTELVIWVGSEDTAFDQLPVANQGQIAAYNPDDDQWRLLQTPPVDVADMQLFYTEGRIIAVGGPLMGGRGATGPTQQLFRIDLDIDRSVWVGLVEPGATPFTKGAVAALGPDDSVTVLTSPSVFLLGRDTWTSLGPVHHCEDELDVVSADGILYVKGWTDEDTAQGCAIYIFSGMPNGDSLDLGEKILGSSELRGAGSTFRSGFVSTPDGRLVTLFDSNLAAAASRSGSVTIGVFQP